MTDGSPRWRRDRIPDTVRGDTMARKHGHWPHSEYSFLPAFGSGTRGAGNAGKQFELR